MKRGRAGADERAAQLQAMTGASLQAAQAWIASQEPDEGAAEGAAADTPDLSRPTAVWPENAAVLGLFMRLQTQWLHSPDGRPEGLSYPAVEARMNALQVKPEDRARLWDALDDMEHAVLEAWDEL